MEMVGFKDTKRTFGCAGKMQCTGCSDYSIERLACFSIAQLLPSLTMATWKYVNSGFVHDLMDTIDGDRYFVRAHVWPSMRTELLHNVVVVISLNREKSIRNKSERHQG